MRKRIILALVAILAGLALLIALPAAAKVPGPNGRIVFARFDPALGSPRTWLFAITRNVIADLGRARLRQPIPAATPEPPPEEESLNELLLAWQMEEALRRIGDDHRRVLVETQLRGRSHSELAAELGIPVGTVKSRVYYGLRALRNVLEEMGYGD